MSAFPPKPPLGLRPKFIVDRQRAIEILEASLRYMGEGKPIEDEWLDELDEINNRMKTKQATLDKIDKVVDVMGKPMKPSKVFYD